MTKYQLSDAQWQFLIDIVPIRVKQHAGCAPNQGETLSWNWLWAKLKELETPVEPAKFIASCPICDSEFTKKQVEYLPNTACPACGLPIHFYLGDKKTPVEAVKPTNSGEKTYTENCPKCGEIKTVGKGDYVLACDYCDYYWKPKHLEYLYPAKPTTSEGKK